VMTGRKWHFPALSVLVYAQIQLSTNLRRTTSSRAEVNVVCRQMI
jgi:hypothetical protein